MKIQQFVAHLNSTYIVQVISTPSSLIKINFYLFTNTWFYAIEKCWLFKRKIDSANMGPVGESVVL